MRNPFDYFMQISQPLPATEDVQEQARERATSFFCFWGILAGSYSCLKWIQNDVPALYLGSLVLIIGPFLTMLSVRFRTFSPIISANMAVACMAFYCGVLNYQLGGINSAHILWTVGIIIFAYLLTDFKSGIFWSSLVFIYTTLLIIGDRQGYAFPVHELDGKQSMINDYSGYLLPVILLWVAQAYSMKVRNRSLSETQEALAEAHQLTQKADVMSSNLSEVIEQAATSSEELLSASDRLNQTISSMSAQSQNICSAVDRQASEASQINETLIGMAESVQNSSRVMSNINVQTNDAENNVISSADAMNKAIDCMEHIRESNKGIMGIMAVISDIAEQTNLLALNASIEAARAGDQGRGFAVVADEVRNLAQKSDSSSTQIKELLDQAASDVNEGSKIVNEAGEILTVVVSSVREISRQITQVNDEIVKQSRDIEGVVESSNEVTQISEANARSGQELLQGSTALSEMAEKLSDLAQSMHQIVNK